jgi:predicted nucleic acid-binding protein
LFGARASIHVAERWGVLSAKLNRTPPAIDSLLAATALHHGLRLVTRNEQDYDFPTLEVIYRRLDLI